MSFDAAVISQAMSLRRRCPKAYCTTRLHKSYTEHEARQVYCADDEKNKCTNTTGGVVTRIID